MKPNEFIKKYPALLPIEGCKKLGIDHKEYAKLYKAEHRKTYLQFMKSIPKEAVVTALGEVKIGLEIRDDDTVINWTTKTIITDLGEFGSFVCSFDMHNAIQRAYVYQSNTGLGETASEVAMRFDFAHAKAVYRYAKIHGFTKASPPQTDLEVEINGDVERAVTENIQHFKRLITKKTEQAKWREIQKGYDKWVKFNSGIYKPLMNHIEQHLPKYKPRRIKVKSRRKQTYGLVVGMGDWHYMRLCYTHEGVEVYNREIAKDRIAEHTAKIIQRSTEIGKIDKIFLMVGNDNLHVDNPAHTTTHGTTQVAQTSGTYALEIDKYMDITIDYIESFAQVADLEVLVVPGNHNERVAELMGVFIERLYRDRKDVTVKRDLHARIYTSYGKNGLIFTHGTAWSVAKLQNTLHRLIMSEAKIRGIDMNLTERFLAFSGHYHSEEMKDLNGFVRHFVFPSLSATEWFDDSWHTTMGYIGREPESSAYLIDKEEGRRAIIYV